jgi:hypothetical protein
MIFNQLVQLQQFMTMMMLVTKQCITKQKIRSFD